MKKRILSLVLAVSMLISMCSLGITVAAEDGNYGISTTSVNDESTMHEIYWTRSVEYSPWLTESSDKVAPDTLYNPVAVEYDAATTKYLGSTAGVDHEFDNPYVLNMGRGTTERSEFGYTGTDEVNDLEETLNDSRMQIAYVDPYFLTLATKADMALSADELVRFETLYNKIVATVQSYKINPRTGGIVKSEEDIAWDAILTNPLSALSEEEKTEYETLLKKRYDAMTKEESAMLKLYESDYNKAQSDKLIHDTTYIWDGGYCPVEDDGSTKEVELGSKPTTKVGNNERTENVDYGWASPTLDSNKYVGDVTGKERYYYVNLETLAEGKYQLVPTDAYFKLGDKYYKVLGNFIQLPVTAGDWQITAEKVEEVTDVTLIDSFKENVYPDPLTVSGFSLNKTDLTLDVTVRSEGAFKDTVMSYQSDYIALNSVTPSQNIKIDSVTYEIVSGADLITLGTPDESNPYAVKVTANQNVANSGVAQIKCTLTSNGTPIEQFVNVIVTKTLQGQAVNPQYGIYCRGLEGELGNNSTELRLGNVASQGQWATWMAWVDSGETFGGPIETLRRFTGYVYLTENDFRSGNTLYFSALEDILISGDDSFSIVVNGVPFFRADITLHNNYVNDAGVKFEESRTQMVNTCTACGDDCSITSEEKRDLYRYGGATIDGPWHAHIDTSAAFAATSYLHPGANRIDIISGDVAQGGGMSRIYLYSSEANIFHGNLDVRVDVYTDPSCADEYLVTGPLEVNTRVYYKYTVVNTGTDPVYNVVVRDPTVGVIYESDKYQHGEGIGPYGDDPYNLGNGEGKKDTPNYVDQTATITTTEMGMLAGLAMLNPGEENAQSIVIATKWNGGEEPKEQGASIVGEFPGIVINTVYASADNVDEVSDQTSVTFVESSEIKDDYAVIDFGLPVTIPVLANDDINGSVTVNVKTGEMPTSEEDLHKFSEATDVTDYGANAAGKYGNAKVTDNNEVTYTPTKIVNDVDEFTYSVTKGSTNAIAEVNVVPASSVYYEDTIMGEKVTETTDLKTAYMSGKIIYSSDWQVKGNQTTVDSQSYDNKANHGYDAEYDTAMTGGDTVYSGGQSHAYGAVPTVEYEGKTYTISSLKTSGLEASIRSNLMKQLLNQFTRKSAYVTFAFEGTGFDIISRCTSDSGIITANVYKSADVESGAAAIDEDGKITGEVVKTLTINNVREGGAFAQEQTPSITIKDLPHEEYVVQIVVGDYLNPYSDGAIVYVDAIRVYNPLNANGEDVAKVEEYYKEANETNSVVYKVRDLILNNDGQYGAGATEDYLNGGTRVTTNDNLVYYLPSSYLIDDGTYKLDESASATAKYAQLGPKSEVYLQKGGDGFAFEYDASKSTTVTLQIDAKVIDTVPETGVALKVTNTTNGLSKTVYVKSGTQMFYDFTSLIGSSRKGTFIVQNASADNNVIAITNMKIPQNSTDNSPVLSSAVAKPTAVTINGSDKMYTGTTQRLSVSIEPTNAIYTEINWASKNPDIVSVDSNGNVSVVLTENKEKEQTATITATVGEITVEHVITVLVDPKKIEKIDVTTDPNTDIHVGDIVTVNAAITPDDAQMTELDWSISDSSVATLSIQDGIVTVEAKKIGTVTVTATAKDGSGVTGTATINVVKIDVEEISANIAGPYTVGDTIGDVVTITPEHATEKGYSWIVEDTSIITVMRDNTLYAAKDGTTKVTLVSADNAEKKAEYTVTVNKPTVTGIKLSTTDISIGTGEEVKMPSFTLEPAAASYLSDKVTMEIVTSNDAVFAHETTGRIYGAETLNGETSKEATLRLVYTNDDGTKASAEFTVTVAAEQTSFNKMIFRVNRYETVNASGQTFVYNGFFHAGGYTEWNNESIQDLIFGNTQNEYYDVTVDVAEAGSEFMLVMAATTGYYSAGDHFVLFNANRDGIVDYQSYQLTGNNAYSATENQLYTISYYTSLTDADGNKVPIFTVSFAETTANSACVPIKETGVLINNGAESVDVAASSSVQLTATVMPSNASNKTVKWSSSNPNVASVDADTGVVTGVAQGTAVITAVTQGSMKTDTIVVNVAYVPLTGMEIADKDVVMYPGDTYQMHVAYTPASNSQEGVTWSISPSTGATIDPATGVITAIEAGNYTVTATTSHGSLTEIYNSSVIIEVRPIVESVQVILEYSDSYQGYYSDATMPSKLGYGPTNMLGSNVNVIVNNDGNYHYVALHSNLGYVSGQETILILKANKDGSLSYECAFVNRSPFTAAKTDYSVRYDVDSKAYVISRTGSATSDASGNVKPTEAAPTAISKITWDTNDLMNGTATLTAVPNQSTFKGCTYTWSSSNTSVADFANANSGVLTLKAKGETEITVKISGGNLANELTMTINFQVIGPDSLIISSADVSKNDAVIVADKSEFALVAKYNTGSVATASWSSDNTNIATIDAATGAVKFTGTAFGPVTFTATAGNYTDTFAVTAYEKVYPDITLSDASDTLVAGTDKTYDVTFGNVEGEYVIPDKSFTPESSNTTVATVVAGTGETPSIVVTPLSEGSATITVTGGNGKKAILEITVARPAITGIEITASAESVEVGKSIELTATVTPTGADQTVNWTVTGDATLSATTGNTVTLTAGTTSGEVTVTATSADEAIYATKSITVTEAVTSSVPTWNANTTYVKGNVVLYNGEYYVANVSYYQGATPNPVSNNFGWSKLTSDPTNLDAISEIVDNKLYNPGDLVMIKGELYAFTYASAATVYYYNSIYGDNHATFFTAVTYPAS